MAWLWMLFPLVVLALTLGLWRATTALGRARTGLQSEVDAFAPMAERARGVQEPDSIGRATEHERADR